MHIFIEKSSLYVITITNSYSLLGQQYASFYAYYYYMERQNLHFYTQIHNCEGFFVKTELSLLCQLIMDVSQRLGHASFLSANRQNCEFLNCRPGGGCYDFEKVGMYVCEMCQPRVWTFYKALVGTSCYMCRYLSFLYTGYFFSVCAEVRFRVSRIFIM